MLWACEFLRICHCIANFDIIGRIFWAVNILDGNCSPAQTKSCLNRFSEALSVGSVDFDSIYPDIDVVSEVLLEGRWILKIRLPTIHLPCQVSLFDHRLEQICVRPFPVADDRRPDAYAMALELPEDIVHDLLHRSSGHLIPALGAMRYAYPSPKQS